MFSHHWCYHELHSPVMKGFDCSYWNFEFIHECVKI